MDPILKTNEVIEQSTLSPYNFPQLTEICEKELSNSYENYQESVFRSLTSNFDNNSSISTVNEAYDNLERCFIENNILTKHGISKFKASASSKLLLNYRDIEDAFADMVFSENARKRVEGNDAGKKIDLKRFKDDIFPIKLYDFPLSDNEDSQSNSEGIEDSESLFESFLSDNEVSDHDEFVVDTCENEAPASVNVINGFRLGRPLSIDLSQIVDKSHSNDQNQQSNSSNAPLKDTVRDVRVVVEKLPGDISDVSIVDEDDNFPLILTDSSPRTPTKEARQVARKRTGGMVNYTVSEDGNIINREQKIIQQLSSKDGEFVPSVFDKMTRAGKRDLERVLAESTANLVIQKTSQLITEKIKELRPCDNESDSSSEDEAAERDIHKTAEIVTNTIIEFLTKSKCKKLEKLGKDISDEISSKLNSLKFGNEVGNDATQLDVNLTQTSNKSNSDAENKADICLENKTEICLENKVPLSIDLSQIVDKSHSENKTEICLENKAETCLENKTEICLENKNVKLSGDKVEESSLKRVTREAARKKNNKKNNTAPFQDAEELSELSRIENKIYESLENSADVIDRDLAHDEPRRPETRQSKQKQEEDAKNMLERDCAREESRRPETRHSKQKQDDAKYMAERDPDRDEPRRPETRQSKQKQEDEAKNLPERAYNRDEPRRPETRQSKQMPEEDVKNLSRRNSVSDEPKRPDTRLSKLNQADNVKRKSELVAPKVTVKPVVKSKRKKGSRSRRRKGPNKQTGKNTSGSDTVVPQSTVVPLIDGQFLIDSELNEEPTFCVSNSSPNKVLNTTDEFTVSVSPPVTDGAILKASADSTTFDTTLISNERSINCSDESNSEKAGEVIQPKESSVNTNRICEANVSYKLSSSDVRDISAKSEKEEDVQCHSSQDENNSQCSSAFDNLKPTNRNSQSDERVSNTVDSTNKKLGNDIVEETLNINEAPNELVENRENINLEEISKISNTSKKCETPKQKLKSEKPANDKQVSVEDTHSQVSSATSSYVPSQLLNDIITNIEKNTEANSGTRGLHEICKVTCEESTETLADSTSFLNYTLDDSFRLIVDESTPKKGEIEKQEQPIESCAETKTKNDLTEQNNASTSEIETEKILHNENSVKDQEKLRLNVVQNESINKVNDKNNKPKKQSASEPENKLGSSAKPLTNEEKIARITNRDPRLVNDKKMVNVLIRDPRLRNKQPKVEESQEKPVQPKLPQPLILDSPQSPDPITEDAPIKPLLNVEQVIDEKKTLLQCDTKITELTDNSDLHRRKKFRKEVDEELLYKTPLSDLHASTSTDRPTYVRNIKPKRQVNIVRKDKDVNEDGRSIGQRRNRAFEEPTEERRNEENFGVYNEPSEDQLHGRCFNQGPSFNDRSVRVINEEVNHRLEEQHYGGNYERRDFQAMRQTDYQSGSRQNYEPEGYARRTTCNLDRRDFPDNQFYSRREFYRRNKYSHDHDHFSNSSRFVVELNQEQSFCPQNESFAVTDDSIFRASAYPPVSLLPDPMYSQEEDFDQSFSNMDNDSFSPPSSDLCPPPPPVIRPPTPDRLRRESFCPSPPRIGRGSPDRDYEEYNRSFQRKYDRDERSLRGRSNFSRDNINTRSYRGGNYRRGNGRDYRRNEESPPRKKFVMEQFGGREDNRGRWRRSPSWSPDRSRRWSSDRSLSPPEQRPWESSPPEREPRPWDSPPSSTAPRRVDNYRERTQSYKNYRRY